MAPGQYVQQHQYQLQPSFDYYYQSGTQQYQTLLLHNNTRCFDVYEQLNNRYPQKTREYVEKEENQKEILREESVCDPGSHNTMMYFNMREQIKKTYPQNHGSPSHNTIMYFDLREQIKKKNVPNNFSGNQHLENPNNCENQGRSEDTLKQSQMEVPHTDLKTGDKRTDARVENHIQPQLKKHKAKDTKWAPVYKNHYSHPWQLNSFKGHTREVLDADFSSNGKYLATCSDDDPGSTSTEDSGGNGSSSSESNKENTLSSSSDSSVKSLSRRQKKNRTKSIYNSSRSLPPQQEPQTFIKCLSDDTNTKFKQKKTRSPRCEMGLREDQLYDLLLHFTLQPDQLFTNGYPDLNEHNEVRILKRSFPTPFRVPYVRKKCDSDTDSDQTSNSSDSCEDNELGRSSFSSSPVLNKTVGVERTCTRCNTGFFITGNEYLTKERCLHHWGKILNHHTYSCCKRAIGTTGCSSSKYHVWNGTVNGVNERLEGFVKTRVSRTNKKRKVYALDCEMCYTVKGLELCKVTILGFNGTVVYDHFVKPECEVVDYNTRYSGVTESDVNSFNSKSFSEVQRDLLDLIGEETILLGHGLDNDLRVLKLLHSKVVDTSLIFPHVRGHPYRYSLKHLMLTHLNKQIQTCESGHDSHEDALSCLELIFFKIRNHYGPAYLNSIKNKRYT